MGARPLVIAVHGSTQPASAEVASELRDAVAARLPGVQVRMGTVDRALRSGDATPGVRLASLADALGDVRRAEPDREAEPGAGTAAPPREALQPVIVPAFLTAGYHVRDDIGADAGAATVTGHVGPHLADALADRVREAGGPGRAILLAAAGSKRPDALAEVERAASTLCWQFGVPVRVGYLYGDGRPVEEVFAELASDGIVDVTVATYALSPGGYASRLKALAAARVTEPLGVHAGVVDAIVTLYRSAPPARTAEHEQRALDALSAPEGADGAAERALLGLAAPTPYLAGLHLAGRRVLVAGGGAVASRRVPGLLAAGALVEVVAPTVSPELEALAQGPGTLTWTRRPVTANDVDGAWFVLAATSDPDANALVAAESERQRVFCVRADHADAGTARTPATGAAAGVTLGVLSSAGRHPARAARARDAAIAALDAWRRSEEGAA